MTPKEKAQELVEKFKDYVHGYVGSSRLIDHEFPEVILSKAKQCALISVDEILKYTDSCYYEWLKEVKQEIEKL